MELRPYQKEAKEAIFEQWTAGIKNPAGPSYWMWQDSSLAKVTEECVRQETVFDPGTQRGAAGTGCR